MSPENMGPSLIKPEDLSLTETRGLAEDAANISTSLLDCSLKLCNADKALVLLRDSDGNKVIRTARNNDKTTIDNKVISRWEDIENALATDSIRLETGESVVSLISGECRGGLFGSILMPFASSGLFAGVLYIEKEECSESEMDNCMAMVEQILFLFELVFRNYFLFSRSLKGSSLLEKSYADILALFEISRNMISQRDPDKLLHNILTKACAVIDAERGSIFLLDKNRTELFDRVSIGSDSLKEIRFSISKGIAGKSAREGKAIIVDSASEHEEFNPDIDRLSGYATMSIMCVPLFDQKNIVFGVMELINKREGVFTGYDLDLLRIFTTTTSKIIENAQLFKSNLDNQLKIESLNERLRRTVIDQSLEISRIKEILDIKQTELEEKYRYHSLIGRSQKMQDVYLIIDKVKDTPFSVLVQGGSGTGKELVAKAIHYNSVRRKKHFVAVNCAAITRSLLESELFGHVKGAFTGADRDKKGLFEIAHGGTLLLDEIGEMDFDLQAKLLRVIEEKHIRKVGGTVNIPVDVRIISATNRRLASMVSDGNFREDLFYRLNVIEINLPALCEKMEDIPLLVHHIMEKIQSETGRKIEIDNEVIRCFQNYKWPGNVRELENEIKRAAALSDSVITMEFVSAALKKDLRHEKRTEAVSLVDEGFCLDKTINDFEVSIIVQAIEKANGNKAEAAKLLGIPRTSLYNKLKKHNMSIYGHAKPE